MKKPPRNAHRRKAKSNRSHDPYKAGSNGRRPHTSRRSARLPAGGHRPRLSREVAVLYEDDALIVLNKPAGLLAVPIKGSNVPSALSLLIAELKPKRQRALIVHRIDRFASGILLFAKTDRDRDALIRQFWRIHR